MNTSIESTREMLIEALVKINGLKKNDAIKATDLIINNQTLRAICNDTVPFCAKR